MKRKLSDATLSGNANKVIRLIELGKPVTPQQILTLRLVNRRFYGFHKAFKRLGLK